MARFMRTDLGSGHSQLQPPAVVNAAAVFIAPGLSINLAPRNSLWSRNNRRRPETFLRPPAVVGDGIVFAPIRGRLHPAGTTAEITRRRASHGYLAPPVVITLPAPADLARPIETKLAESTRRGRRAKSVGIGPYVVFDNNRFFGPHTTLVDSARRDRLRRRTRVIATRPVVVFDTNRFFGPHVSLAYSRRGVAHASLRRPVVVSVTAAESFYGPQVALAQQPPRGPRQTRLGRPVVIFVNAYYGPAVQLAYSRRGRARPVSVRPTVVFAPPLARPTVVALARSFRGRPKSILRAPAAAAAAQAGTLATHLARTDRRYIKTRSTYVFPLVVFRLQALGGIGIQLVRRPNPSTRSRLSTPPVVAVAQAYYGPKVNLARAFRRTARYWVRGPVVIDVTPQTKYLAVHITYSRRGRPTSFLVPPQAIVEYPQLGDTLVVLAKRPNPSTRSRLSAPAVVTAVAQIYYGPRVTLVKQLRRSTRSFLRPPVIPPVARPIDVTLAASRRGRAQSELRAPAVIDVRPQVYYLSVTLVRIRPQPTTKFLSPPTDLVDEQDKGRVRVTLAYSRRGAPRSELRAPVVIDNRPQTVYLATWLAYSRRGAPKSRLEPPAVIDTRVYFGPFVHLTYSRRGVPKSVLRAPVDTVGLEDQGRVKVTLVRIRPVATRYALRPPTVIDNRPQVYYLAVSLAYSRRGVPKSRLTPPTVVDVRVYYGPSVTLTYSSRGVPKSVLHAPTVIDVRPQAYYLTVWLAYSRRGAPKSRLEPPTVVDVRVYSGPSVTLAYSVRGVPKSRLEPPTVIDVSPQTVYLAVTLTYSRRGRPLSRLQPPAVVFHDAFYGPFVWLTYSLRGAPKSKLRVPVVIDLRPQTYYVSVNLTYSSRRRGVAVLRAPAVISRDIFFTYVKLTYSRRGRPIYKLRPPTVIDVRPQTRYLSVYLTYSVRKRGVAVLRKPTRVFAFIARPVDVTLAYSLRGTPKPRLSAPVVVREFIAPPVKVALAYSRRGRPVYDLKPPTVVGPVLARHIVVWLAYSRRGQPKSFLNPPARVRPFFARDIQVTLAPQSRGKTRSLLLPPAVVRYFTAPPISVRFVRIRPQPTTKFLRPPTVVNTPEPVLYPIVTWLAYSLRGKPIHFLRPPQALIFVPDQGDVCGFDIAGSFICSDEEAGSAVTETTAPGSIIAGTDRPGNSSTGGDQPGSAMTGTDRKNT